MKIQSKFKYIKKVLKDILSNNKYDRIYNLNLFNNNFSKGNNKLALLSYITHPFSLKYKSEDFLRHINNWHAIEIVKILNEKGFLVDVIDYRDQTFIPEKKYDLFIGHGGINFEKIAGYLGDKTIKIYFSTGSYWKYHNQQEELRFMDLNRRKGVTLPRDREIKNSEEGALELSDGIIGIGNEFTRTTYKKFQNIKMINTTTFSDGHFNHNNFDYHSGASNFLFFSGGGNVHKGLDRLLDAFSDLDQHLWICTDIRRDFFSVYRKELTEMKNIHLIGRVNKYTSQFYEIVDQCGFIILPSCSEGCATSVIDCMVQGLITIISSECGIEVDEFGFYLETCEIEELKKIVLSASNMDIQKIRAMSIKSNQVAATEYSDQKFRINFEKALWDIIRI